jgi:hypothetical protein
MSATRTRANGRASVPYLAGVAFVSLVTAVIAKALCECGVIQ